MFPLKYLISDWLSRSRALNSVNCIAAKTSHPRSLSFLQQGQLEKAQEHLDAILAADAKHEQARFALGVVHVLSAIEQLGQEQYQYGALSGAGSNVPIFRLPVPSNPNPEEVNYTQVRQVISHFQTRLAAAEAILAQIDLKQEVKLPIDLLSIRLDLNGNKRADEFENFASLFELPIASDRAPQLRTSKSRSTMEMSRGCAGIAISLCAFCDLILAYDHQQMFDVSGHLILSQGGSSGYDLPPLDLEPQNRPEFSRAIMDAIAAIHLANFPLKEPKRMSSLGLTCWR